MQAYRDDINESSDIALLASWLRLTIRVYNPPYPPDDMKLQPPQSGEAPVSGHSTAILLKNQTYIGKGPRLLDLFYNRDTKRYETLYYAEDGSYRRLANTGTSEETSLYHCISAFENPDSTPSKQEDPLFDYSNKIRLTRSSINSNAYVRGVIARDFPPGPNAKKYVDDIPRRGSALRRELRILVGQLREELDAAEPPRINVQDYSTKLCPVRELLEDLEYNLPYLGYLSANELAQQYNAIQQKRIYLLKKGYKTPNSWQRKKVYQKRIINDDENFKAVALTALLDDDSIDINEKFRLTTRFITTVKPEKLKAAYMRIHGSTDVGKLEADLKSTFHVEGDSTSPLRRFGEATKYFSVGEGHKLQFAFLKSLLDFGQQSPSAQLAIKMGLMYRGAQINNLTQEQKDYIKSLVAENPGELAALAVVDGKGDMLDTTDEFLVAVHAKLANRHPAVLNDVQLQIRETVTTGPISENDSDVIGRVLHIEDGPPQILINLLYDTEKGELRRLGKSRLHTAPVDKVILKWMKGLSQEQLAKFIAAGNNKDGKPKTIYHKVWWVIDGQMKRGFQTDNWTQYYVDMASAQLRHGAEAEKLRPFREVEALLKYKRSRCMLSRYFEKEDTLGKVLNILSATDEWDPMASLEMFIRDNPDIKHEKEYEEIKADPIRYLNKLLDHAGVDKEGIEQVNVLLFAGGSYQGENATDSTRNIDNYLSLKSKAYSSFCNTVFKFSLEEILEPINKVEPGSLEHWLLRNDKKLLTQIRKELRSKREDPTAWIGICHTLDLDEIWNDLDENSSLENRDHIMPKPPSLQERKAFKEKYEGVEKKKKIWAGKYALAYSLGQVKSLSGKINRKDLLKVVYAAQLEGYTGEEFKKLLGESGDALLKHITETPSPGNTADGLLHKFLVGNEDIEFEEFLEVAGDDSSIAHFAINDISAQKSLRLWCSNSLSLIQDLSKKRMEQTKLLLRLQSETTGAPSEMIKIVEEEISSLDEKIKTHQFRIDSKQKSQLRRLIGNTKTQEFEAILKHNVGEAMLAEPEKFKDFDITPLELRLMGGQMLAEVGIESENYLRTGKGFHRATVTGLEAFEEVNTFLSDLYKFANMGPTGTVEQRQIEADRLLETLKISHRDMMDSLDTWKHTQDVVKKRINMFVNQTLTVAIIVAFTSVASFGVTGGLAVLMGFVTAGVQAIVQKQVEKVYSRKGDISTKDVLMEIMVGAIATLPGFFSMNALSPIINNSIGSAMVQLRIDGISGDIVGKIMELALTSSPSQFQKTAEDFKENEIFHKITGRKILKTVAATLNPEWAVAVTEGRNLSGTFEKPDQAPMDGVNGKSKPYTILYNKLCNMRMAITGFDYVAEELIKKNTFPDEEEKKEDIREAAISTSLVEALVEKGLKLGADFEYRNTDTLLEQIAGNMPGVALTRLEMRELKKSVGETFESRRQYLTDEQRQMTEAKQLEIMIHKAHSEKLLERTRPLVSELVLIRDGLERDYDRISADVEAKVEEKSKGLRVDVKAKCDGKAVKDGILTSGAESNRGNMRTQRVTGGDNDINVAARAVGRRIGGISPEQRAQAHKDKVNRQNRHKKKMHKKRHDAVGE